MHSSKAKARPGSVRIIGGEHRGRRIAVPPRPDVRPTPDRVRETLFNWLGQWLDGLSCLDLYAGTGALGFEAASRGARRVVMVESDREAFAGLEKTKAMLRAAQVELVRAEALGYLGSTAERFDVVFLDPPFRQNAHALLLSKLPARLAEGARIYVESGASVPVEPPWRELKSARAGQVSYQLLEWKGDD